MEENQNEKITINNRRLMLGVLSTEDGTGYQLYTTPGLSVAEIAFEMMVIIRMLEADNYIKNKDDVIALMNKYYNDPQYAPVEKAHHGEVPPDEEPGEEG